MSLMDKLVRVEPKVARKVKLVLGEDKWDVLRLWWVTSKLRYERGFLYVNLIKQPLMVVAMFKIFDFPMWLMVAFVPFWFIVVYFMGWIDQFKIKVWQKEYDWQCREINPFYTELMDRIKRIEDKVNKLGGR